METLIIYYIGCWEEQVAISKLSLKLIRNRNFAWVINSNPNGTNLYSNIFHQALKYWRTSSSKKCKHKSRFNKNMLQHNCNLKLLFLNCRFIIFINIQFQDILLANFFLLDKLFLFLLNILIPFLDHQLKREKEFYWANKVIYSH